MTQDQLIVDLVRKQKMWREWSDRAIGIIENLTEDEMIDRLETIDIAIAQLRRDREALMWGEV